MNTQGQSHTQTGHGELTI